MKLMAESTKIVDFFKASGIDPVGSAVWDRETSSHLVFISVQVNDDGKQVPSNYKLSLAERDAEAKYGEITVILVNRGDEDISRSIKSVLLRRFSDDIRNVFSRVVDGRVTVWVDTKSASSREKTVEMERPVTGIVEHFGLQLLNFVNTSEVNIPSETVCVNTIRTKAPVSSKEVINELRQKGFEVPSEKWLSPILDRLRKRGLIYRQSNGSFVMTVMGLKVLGSGKNRRSPDVARALDLARRVK